MNEGRWERALHETKGLGNWRRDIPLLAAIVALTFIGLRLLDAGEVGSNLISAVLVGLGVLVLLPLFELLYNYRKASKAPEEQTTPVAGWEPVGPQEGRETVGPEQEQERYRSLRDRLTGGSGGPRGGSGPE
jgi:hypothetical protein